MNRWLTPLATGFGGAVKLREQAYSGGWMRARRLKRPVISVGNLTVGGTGKTPIVVLVAELLIKNGLRPSILTRGYGRRSHALMTIEPADRRQADPRQVGDEPALMAQKLPETPILVSRERFCAGTIAEEMFGVNAHILDDGFQHWALARDLDIVLMDLTQPLGNDALLPAGRLREPISALRRAGALLLTRAELTDGLPAERLARQMNPVAPIFHSTLKLAALSEVATKRVLAPSALEGKPVFAFCGLGNPTSFFASLHHWGFKVAGQKTFRDHHIYSERGLMAVSRMAVEAKAEACVTTEKDAMNFPGGAAERSPLPIFCCAIRAEVREAACFEGLLLRVARGEESRA